MTRKPRIRTQVVHAGEPVPRILGAVTTPIFQSAMYEFGVDDDRHDLKYVRLSNTPNHAALHEKLARLEGAEAALVAASGMAAISTTLLAFLSAGDHALAQDTLYGGTHDFLTKDVGDYGIEVDFVDGDDPDSWEGKLRPTTRLFYFETLTNPLLQMPDVEAAVAFARAHGLLTVVDNTFPSPVNFRPTEHGIDLSLHSATKYLNGHSDLVAGAVIGSAEAIARVRRKLDHLGGSLDPHACFLLSRGIKTLAVRMQQHERNAGALAELLDGHPAVRRVHYPGLPDHPGHERAARLLDGFGGMLSFELEGGFDAARRFLERVELPVVAPSLGGVESLVTLPARTSHAGMSAEARAALGITDGLVRFSTGIEDTDDVVEDVARALASS